MGKYKWETLQHNGVMFPPEYVKHNVPVLYKGDPIVLEERAEEYATLYAKYCESEYLENSTFRRNFWKDWKDVLGKEHVIQNLEECNFKLIYDYLIKQKELNKELKKEDDSKFRTALLDGKEQAVGNFRMEPPAIFIGRGCNPKLGKVKGRIYPENVTLNLSKDALIPETLEGHKWGKIVHDRTAVWLASWPDTISNKTKYLWLAANSDIKAKSDMEKFDLARKLKRKIKTIREENEKHLEGSEVFMKQLATALFFIDRFALRVGNEKSSDEADTFGVTSLLVKHIVFLDDYKIELDFLGKDSIRYKRVLLVDIQVYKNLKEFVADKQNDDELFDKIKSADINRYLQNFMKNLTAKVFRTMNASVLFQKELNKVSKKFDTYEEADKINILLDEFNKANAKVAMLCNHQKNVNKSNVKQIESINEMIKKQKKALRKAKKNPGKNAEKIELIKSKIKILKSKKELKIEMKNISLDTSKTNYIDPRIGIAFMMTHNLPIDKIYSKVLQDRFKWAFTVDKDFKF